MSLPHTYCKKCGTIGFSFEKDPSKELCTMCGTKGSFGLVPEQYLDEYGNLKPGAKEQIFEELVKTSSEFDQEAHDRVPLVLAQYERQSAMLAAESQGKNTSVAGNNTHPTVTCPYCHGTNTSKISTTSKVINTALFGIFGNKRKHQWHCNGCGSDF